MYRVHTEENSYSHASYFRVTSISAAFRILAVNISQCDLLPV